MQPAGVGVPVDTPEAATLLDNWIHQLRIDGVYGNVASLQCTREDAAAALAFAEPFVGGKEAGGTGEYLPPCCILLATFFRIPKNAGKEILKRKSGRRLGGKQRNV